MARLPRTSIRTRPVATRLLASVAVLPLVAAPAMAVTPEEVMAMFSDMTAAAGAELQMTQSRSGDTLTVGSPTVTWQFPFDAGELVMQSSDYSLTDLGDGTVEISAGDTQTVSASMRLAIEGEEVSFAIGFRINHSSGQSIASGSADDITIATASPTLSMTLDSLDVVIPDEEMPDLSQISGTVTMVDQVSNARYQRSDDLITITGDSTGGEISFTYTVPIDGMNTTEGTGSYLSTANSSTTVLPRGGMSILNLSQAVRDGLKIESTRQMNGQDSSQTNTVDGMISTQSSAIASQSTTFSLSEAGLVVEGGADGIAFSFSDPNVLPFPVSGALEAVAARYIVPVLASPDTAQSAELDMSLLGLTLDPQIWAMGDPAEMLPRDPVDIIIDLGAELRPLIDPLDIMAMIETIDGGETPVELDGVRIDALRISAVGAELEGDGAFTLDFADMMTFPGFPRPEGEAKARLTGANQLIDTLIGMGIISEEDAMGARMGMGMFTQAVGDDVLESQVGINAEGQVMVNGMRVR